MVAKRQLCFFAKTMMSLLLIKLLFFPWYSAMESMERSVLVSAQNEGADQLSPPLTLGLPADSLHMASWDQISLLKACKSCKHDLAHTTIVFSLIPLPAVPRTNLG